MAETGSTTGSDILQIGEVLESAGANADSAAAWLHFSYDAASDATILEVKSQTDAGASSAATIILAGVNLTALGSDGDIISHLLTSWTSHVD
ncbi:MAG: type I secretion C-terminal target domain-containing protein [Betaproteobacteria bacterium]|nr:MAG: type I secretion C-terminal target domain-containing protein [Betaproteobacteria bacterium]